MGERVRDRANGRYKAGMTTGTSKPPLMGNAREWIVDLGVALAIGVVLGVMGPFGSYLNGAPWLRMAYWVGSIVSGMVVFGSLTRLLVALARRHRAPDWSAVPVVILLGTLVQGALTRWAALAIWPELEGLVSGLQWYGQCLATSAPIVVVFYWLRVRPAGRVPPLTPSRPVRLATPEPLPSDEVLCLSMEDHYVRVHTASGSRLIAGPFERVISGLGGREGMRVHRSWWVARSAVAGVEIEGRNLRLTLTNGLRAPVSRASVARLRQMGWLALDH